MSQPEDASPSPPEPNPPWHLLPHQPADFFALAEGFDRKQLKRAYNLYLRQFKPDKFPDEFQKLRAAYEQLDAELRYGEDKSASTTANGQQIDWTPAGPDTNPVPDTAPVPDMAALPRPSLSLLERIESESLEQLYAELQSHPGSPLDYYALALLSDGQFDPKQHQFLDWLLKGLERFPQHPALSQLLAAYLHSSEIGDEDLAKILLSVSQCLKSDRFFYIAESLFDRLLACQGWPRFKQVLDACVENVTDHQIRCRVIFTLHLLRRALWLASLDECEAMVKYLDLHHQYLSDTLEYELELNLRLLAHCKTREQFRNQGPLAAMIDSALSSYCTSVDGQGDQRVVATQVYIAQHPEELFGQFEFSAEGDMRGLVPWIWICEEVEDRLETQPPPTNFDRVMAATLQMMQQIDRNFPAGPVQLYDLMVQGIPILIVFCCAILLPYGVGRLADNLWPLYGRGISQVAFILGAALAAGYWYVLQKHTTSLWMAHYLRRLLLKHYQQWWRSLIGRYFAATHYRYREADRAIDLLVEKHAAQLKVSVWLPHFYGRDVALYAYAAAVRFMR